MLIHCFLNCRIFCPNDIPEFSQPFTYCCLFIFTFSFNTTALQGKARIPYEMNLPSISFFFFFNFILFLNFTQLYQFCQISKWIRHRYTCVPHPEPSSLLPPHSISGGRPRAPAPSIQYPASNLDFAFNFTEENGTLHERNPSFPNVDTFPSKWILSVTGWVHWEADSEKELNIQEIF